VLNLEEKVRPDFAGFTDAWTEEQMIMKRYKRLFLPWYHRAGSGRAVAFRLPGAAHEVAVVTTFGKPTRPITHRGLKIKLPRQSSTSTNSTAHP